MKTRFAIAAAALAGALVGMGLSASADQFTKNGGGSGGGVSQADFNRLKGQVEAVEGRVAALERMSVNTGGQKGGKSGGGKTGGKSGGGKAGGAGHHKDGWTGG